MPHNLYALLSDCPFQQMALEVRVLVQDLEILAKPANHLLDNDKIEFAFAKTTSCLDSMRALAELRPSGHKRDEAFEQISTLSSQLVEQMANIAKHRARYLSREERAENLAFYSASMPQPSPRYLALH